MNPTEAAELLGHAAAFDNRNPSAAAAMAWAAALEDVPLDADAKAAVAMYYRTPPQNSNERLWILPHHVRTLRTKIRNARLENFQYEPVDGESVPAFLARLRGQVRAVAAGRAVLQSGRLALTGGPHPEFVAELTARGYQVGRPVPDSDEQAVIDSVRRAGPLGVICPACNAAVGRPCKAPGGSDKQPLGKPRLKPHSARLRAVLGGAEQSAEERAAEEARRREASRRALARMGDDDIVDAEIVDHGEAS